MTDMIGYAVLAVFFVAYALVFVGERLELRKSKPVMIAAGISWILVALSFQGEGRSGEIEEKLGHVLLEYAELFLFLIAAMSFVNAMVERNVFEAIRGKISAARLSSRGVFWLTGAMAFFLSPIADNMTTALVMGSLAVSLAGDDKKTAAVSLVNVVVAANAGGVFSPFGDITTLMIWQKGVVEFGEFFRLFVPSLINWLVPAAIMSLAVNRGDACKGGDSVQIRKGGIAICAMFAATIAATVALDRFLHLPPFLGMMMGLGALNLYGYFLGKESHGLGYSGGEREKFDAFAALEKIEWDTLLFFYGIMLCVGAIAALGHLEWLSRFMYEGFGPTISNVAIGVLSAVVDNIPLTFAVLTMNPAMDVDQWLLLTLTAGAGGSLLATGSAAGVALLGVGKGSYTFRSHLRWSWAVGLGLAASVVAHLALV